MYLIRHCPAFRNPLDAQSFQHNYRKRATFESRASALARANGVIGMSAMFHVRQGFRIKCLAEFRTGAGA